MILCLDLKIKTFITIFFSADLSSASEGYKWRFGFRKTEVKGEMRVISKVLRHLKSKERNVCLDSFSHEGFKSGISHSE